MTLQVLKRHGAKALALGAAISLGAAAIPTGAEAGHRGGGAAIAGIAAAAIIGGIIASQHRRSYYEPGYYAPPPPPPPYAYAPAPAYRYAPAATYSYGPQPWTPEWYDYCSRKYRSFDPRSGTFQPYHGPRQLCR
ncbi:MAG: BA14K family protein [Pseudomonadota bacterium]|nr:BA14K family protein [Pseudomonadota bacterium]